MDNLEKWYGHHQSLALLPILDGHLALIGSWMIGDKARQHRHPRRQRPHHPKYKLLWYRTCFAEAS